MSFSGQRSGHATQGLGLVEQGFRYGGKLYPYDSVQHLERYARGSSINFIPIGRFVEIKIWLREMQEPITLTNEIGLLWTANALDNIYRVLAEKTFAHRSTQYLDQLQSTGHFDYGGARFFANGDVDKGGMRANLGTSRLYFGVFEFDILSSPSIAVNTRIDRDVLQFLLHRLFGLAFE